MNRSTRWRYLRLGPLAWKLPTYARLVWGIARDRRTPVHLKALLVGALAYLILPIDLIPDALPIVGQADDLTVLLLVLDLVIANAPPEVRLEQAELARRGAGALDADLARMRSLLGDRYDRLRDGLPDFLERYGDLREPEAIRELVATWRTRRAARPDAAAPEGGSADRRPVAARSADRAGMPALARPADPSRN
jgi:uncharacterized membrane protein YkvA (DUF1232 family)